MSIPERRQAARELAEDGESTRGIAEILGTSHTTIENDIGTNVPLDEKREEETTDSKEFSREEGVQAGTNVPLLDKMAVHYSSEGTI
ncbi:hypothetical protein MYX84_00750 [Acidobacteria bacterium AH-259-O06]|nr:hypothetical protein [Acidobacteria bacterium AH-259-O06]